MVPTIDQVLKAMASLLVEKCQAVETAAELRAEVASLTAQLAAVTNERDNAVAALKADKPRSA